MSREVRVRTPAKINLFLGVGAVRPDGYHPLATVYEAVGLYDELVLRPGDGVGVDLTVSGDGVDVRDVPRGERNLAVAAVRSLGRHVGRDLRVSLRLHKRIPVAGGLAGGSSDAAAALRGVDALFDLGLPGTELLGLAAELGSDVPFCLTGGTAIGSGRGELVTPLPVRGEHWWVILPDPEGLSTAAVYAELDRLSGGAGRPEPHVPEALLEGLAAGDVGAVGRALANDLTSPALSLRPDLEDRLDAGRACGAQALVSGSGPTTVFLCTGERHAHQVAATLRARGTAELPTPVVARGPVPGASVTRSAR